MEITREDFEDWKQSNVTKMFMVVISQRLDQVAGRLVDKAGVDPATDRFLCGYAAACKDVLNLDIETVTEGNSDGNS